MSDLSVGTGGTDYPGTIDTFTDKTATDEVKALEWNNLVNAMIKIQATLGTNIKGSIADFATYLQVEHNADGTHKTTWDSPTLVNPAFTGSLTLNADAWPSFSAYVNAAFGSIGSGSPTIVQFDAEIFDTNSNFNNTSGIVGGIPQWAFKPSVAGVYLITAQVGIMSLNEGRYSECRLYKNGTLAKRAVSYNLDNTGQHTYSQGTFIVQADGSDYFQIYAEHNHPSSRNVAYRTATDPYLTYFDASRIA